MEEQAETRNFLARKRSNLSTDLKTMKRVQLLEKDNPRAVICGKHPDHRAEVSDIKKLVEICGNYITLALAEMATDELGFHVLRVAWWFTHYTDEFEDV